MTVVDGAVSDDGRPQRDVGGADDAAIEHGRTGASETAVRHHQLVGVARRDAASVGQERRMCRRLAGLPRRERRLPQRLRPVGARSAQSGRHPVGGRRSSSQHPCPLSGPFNKHYLVIYYSLKV